MNPRRVAITAAALFGTVILVDGVIAAVAGLRNRKPKRAIYSLFATNREIVEFLVGST
jgi:uncharacterized membrane protein HdeD (DUF308 family)